MNESIQLISKINSFVKPLADILLFLFTTQNGIIILISAILILLIIRMYDRIHRTKLLLEASRRPGLTLGTFFRVLIDEIASFVAKIFANITTLAVILLLLFSFVTISLTINSVETFFKNEQRIKELKQVIKNLNQSYRVAKVEILDYDQFRDTTKMQINFYDYSKSNKITQTQTITLPGRDIYVVSLVMNFDYSLIETGQKINIAIPFAVFSNRMKQENAIKLDFADSLGIPLIFKRDTNDVYGISFNTYNDRLKDIVEYLNDPQKAKEAGIRSTYNAAPHPLKVLTKGQTFTINVEQTGGLVIKFD